MSLALKVLPIVLLLTIVTFPALTVQATSAATTEATVFVHPDKITVKVNETFQIFVDVSSVSKLQGFDFMLGYDTSFLNCSQLEEGTFLSDFGPTFVAKREINGSFTANQGRVWLAVVIYGTGFADGNGTLATVTFKAVSAGETALDLYSDFPLRQDVVKLTTCGGQAIPNKAVDGSVVVTAAGSSDPSDPPPSGNPGSSMGPLIADVNGDGIVDVKDLVFVATAFATVEGDLKYSVSADLDHDGMVDIRDVVLVARFYMSRM